MLYNNSSLLASSASICARSPANGQRRSPDPLGDERFGEAERLLGPGQAGPAARRPTAAVRPRGLRAPHLARHLELAQPLDDRPRLRARTSAGSARPTARSQGRGDLKSFVLSMLATFPDLALSVDDVYWMGNEADGHLVAVRWSAIGTHRGNGVYGPPTGRRVRIWGISQHRIRARPHRRRSGRCSTSSPSSSSSCATRTRRAARA